LRDPKRKDVKSLAHAVDERLFQPLRPLIGEFTRLLISPDGALNLIPFAPMVDEKGRKLNNPYSITYLAIGQDMRNIRITREGQSGQLVIANPDFGGQDQVEAKRSLKQIQAAPKKPDKVESSTPAFSQFYFPALPYTAREGEALRALLPGATLLTNRQAS